MVCLSFQSSSQLITPAIESQSGKVTIPSTQLHPGTAYLFTLTVHKMGRTSSPVTQTVSRTTSVGIVESLKIAEMAAYDFTVGLTGW